MQYIPVNPLNPAVVFIVRRTGEKIVGIVESVDISTGKITVVYAHHRYHIRPQHIECIQW